MTGVQTCALPIFRRSRDTRCSFPFPQRSADLLPGRDYNYVSTGGGSTRAAALLSGKIDALPTFPPISYELEKRGFNVVADHTEDVVFKQLQDVTPAHIAAVTKGVLANAPSADGVYIPCNQWSGADAAPLIEKECGIDRKSTRLNSSHRSLSRMPSSA